MSLLKVKNISKIYQTDVVKTVALDDVSFEIEKGEFVAIMGPSGSGKSTLMHIIGALDLPTSGEYYLDGENVSQLKDSDLAELRNKKIGFVFQAFNLLPRTSSLKNVMLPMKYGDIPKHKRETIAKRYLKIVGLEDRMYHKSNQLSGGQKQRVAIARALVMNPSIILADEPTGNISGKHVDEIMKTLVKLNKEGHTIIIITHEQEVADYAQRIISLRNAKLVGDKRKK
jgi:putative ABC transport system ATP-binding protein